MENRRILHEGHEILAACREGPTSAHQIDGQGVIGSVADAICNLSSQVREAGSTHVTRRLRCDVSVRIAAMCFLAMSISGFSVAMFVGDRLELARFAPALLSWSVGHPSPCAVIHPDVLRECCAS